MENTVSSTINIIYSLKNFTIMRKEEILRMTNDFGKNYLRWFSHEEILGVEKYENNPRKEFFMVYRYNGKVYVCVLPLSDNPDNGCCSFGDLRYFAQVFAHNENGIRILWNPLYANEMVSPVWRNDMSEEEKEKYFRTYNQIMNKYSC